MINDLGNNINFRWGFYADGYFDRRDHNNPFISSTGFGGSAIASNTAVSWNTKDVAYIGSLLPVVCMKMPLFLFRLREIGILNPEHL